MICFQVTADTAGLLAVLVLLLFVACNSSANAIRISVHRHDVLSGGSAHENSNGIINFGAQTTESHQRHHWNPNCLTRSVTAVLVYMQHTVIVGSRAIYLYINDTPSVVV